MVRFLDAIGSHQQNRDASGEFESLPAVAGVVLALMDLFEYFAPTRPRDSRDYVLALTKEKRA